MVIRALQEERDRCHVVLWQPYFNMAIDRIKAVRCYYYYCHYYYYYYYYYSTTTTTIPATVHVPLLPFDHWSLPSSPPHHHYHHQRDEALECLLRANCHPGKPFDYLKLPNNQSTRVKLTKSIIQMVVVGQEEEEEEVVVLVVEKGSSSRSSRSSSSSSRGGGGGDGGREGEEGSDDVWM